MARVEQSLLQDVEEEVELVTLTVDQVLLLDQEGQNLAEYLDTETLQDMGTRVVEDYDKDKKSREKWEERMDEAMELAMQVAEKKTFPFDGAANVKFPLITIGAIQFASRAGPSIVRKPRPVNGKVNGEFNQDKALMARRIGQHMSYQLLCQIPGWEDGQDVMLHTLPIIGSEFKKTYYDGRVQSERVSAKNLVFDYYAKDVESARRKTEVLEMHPQEVKERQNMGRYLEVDLTDPAMGDEHETEEKIQGSEEPGADRDTPHRILEQHRYWDIDGDGYEEPYIVTVDYDSKHVLRVAARFDREGVSYGPRGLVIEPVEYYTQYRFFPDPSGGSLGIGWGHLLFPINEVVDTTINQLLDAGTLQNTGGGFISKQLAKGIKGGKVELAINEYKILDTMAEDLRKGILPAPTPQPSAVLFQLLGLMIEWGQKLTSVTEGMTGDNPPINQPATTTLALLEQGMKVFQGVYQRIFRSFDSELKKIKRLNRLYLDDAEYFQVLDVSPTEVPENAAIVQEAVARLAPGADPGQLEQIAQQVVPRLAQGKVFRTDYEGDDTDVEPSADPSIQTEQQLLVRARAVLEGMGQGIPFNPQWAAERYLDAIQVPESERREAILPPQPPPPDPKLEIERLRQEFQAAMEQMRLQSQAVISQMKEETQRIKIMTGKDTEEKRLALEQDKLSWDVTRDTAKLQDADLDREQEVRLARMKSE